MNSTKILMSSYKPPHRPLAKSVYQKFNFLISKPKHMLWVLKRTVSMRRFFWAPKHMLRLMGKEILTSLSSKILLPPHEILVLIALLCNEGYNEPV